MTSSPGKHGFLLLSLFVTPLLQAQPKAEDVFRYLSRDHPGLAAMWVAYDKGEAKEAKLELLRYFQNRQDRLGTELFASERGDRALAQSNAHNEFSWKGTSQSFGAELRWTAVGIDREWNYSLNRMLWFENFAAVYRETRDETIVRAWRDQILSWIKIGDPGFPRTIDTGRRLESLASSYCVFVNQLKSSTIDPETNAILLASIFEQCEFLYSPDHWRRYSNWGTFESSGLARAVLLFPEFARSPLWLREMFFRMQVQLTLSYTPDGMHVELSPSYHAGELEMWVNFVQLARRNKVKNPWLVQRTQPDADSLLAGPAEALAYMLMPSGNFPRTGDTDDSDRTEMLATMGRFLSSPHLRFVTSGGKEGIRPEQTSKAFSDAGLYFLRTGWGDAGRPYADETFLMFDATVNQPWHSHRDAMNVLLSAYGRDLLVDAGRFTYNEGPDRDLFLSAASHNTVVIDGTDQTKFDTRPESGWKFFDSLDCVWGSRVQGGVTHRRAVYFVKPDYAMVVDYLSGPGSHRLDQYWHLDPSAIGLVRVNGGKAESPGLILSTTAPGLTLGVAPVSQRYRERTEGPLLTSSWEVKGSSVVATLLFPRPGNLDADVQDMTPVAMRDGYRVLGVTYGGDRDLLFIRNPDTPRSVVANLKGVETDADFLLLRRKGTQGWARISALGCTSLRIDGRVYYQDPTRRTDCTFEGKR